MVGIVSVAEKRVRIEKCKVVIPAKRRRFSYPKFAKVMVQGRGDLVSVGANPQSVNKLRSVQRDQWFR